MNLKTGMFSIREQEFPCTISVEEFGSLFVGLFRREEVDHPPATVFTGEGRLDFCGREGFVVASFFGEILSTLTLRPEDDELTQAVALRSGEDGKQLRERCEEWLGGQLGAPKQTAAGVARYLAPWGMATVESGSRGAAVSVRFSMVGKP